MLYFVYKELALGYLLFSFLSAVGVLQIVAARHGFVGLALFNHKGSRAFGYAIGSLLVAASASVFFISQWARIFTPGPAGAELSLLFAIGSASAVVFSLLAGSLRHHLRQRVQVGSGPRDDSEAVVIGRATARLHLPEGPTTPLPAVCLVPSMAAPHQSLEPLIHQLVQQGIVALAIDPSEDLNSYPESLAVLPAATTFLSRRPEVDPSRLGAVGYDLGGDLVIRAASAETPLRAVAALAPVLGEPRAGLDVLREMSYLEALSWSRDHRSFNLRVQLNAQEYLSRTWLRPLLLIYGAEDWLVHRVPPDRLSSGEGGPITYQVVQGAGHLNLLEHPLTIQTVVHWLTEHL